jgi:hypothetical protein
MDDEASQPVGQERRAADGRPVGLRLAQQPQHDLADPLRRRGCWELANLLVGRRGGEPEAEHAVVHVVHVDPDFGTVFGDRGVRDVAAERLPGCLRLPLLPDRAALVEEPLWWMRLRLRKSALLCVVDLEDELIRALGPTTVEAVLGAQGDLGAFRTFQRQPAWRGQQSDRQLHRFLGSADRRKLRYARLLVEALEPSRVPRPLERVLAHV